MIESTKLSHLSDMHTPGVTVLIMSERRHPTTGIKQHIFTLFWSYDSFHTWYSYLYCLTTPPTNLHHYEVIMDTKQKPKFDLEKLCADITRDEWERNIRLMITSIRCLIPQAEIILYRSDDPNNIKYSAHIVIQNYYVSGAKDAYKFMCCVLNNIECDNLLNKGTRCKDIVDTSVYKNIQMFRIEQSSKYEQTRQKYLCTKIHNNSCIRKLDHYALDQAFEKYLIQNIDRNSLPVRLHTFKSILKTDPYPKNSDKIKYGVWASPDP